MIRVSVLYPAREGATFADFQKAMAAHGAEIMADVPNYTNLQPQVQISEIVG